MCGMLFSLLLQEQVLQAGPAAQAATLAAAADEDIADKHDVVMHEKQAVDASKQQQQQQQLVEALQDSADAQNHHHHHQQQQQQQQQASDDPAAGAADGSPAMIKRVRIAMCLCLSWVFYAALRSWHDCYLHSSRPYQPTIMHDACDASLTATTVKRLLFHLGYFPAKAHTTIFFLVAPFHSQCPC
jgi:hypothetical protein